MPYRPGKPYKYSLMRVEQKHEPEPRAIKKFLNHFSYRQKRIIKTLSIVMLIAIAVYWLWNNLHIFSKTNLLGSYVVIAVFFICVGLATVVPLEIEKKIISGIIAMLLFFTLIPGAYNTIEASLENKDISNVNKLQQIFKGAPEREIQCKEAFDYVNTLREEEGRAAIQWDDRLYELAVFRSKDMYERNYFDHVTPEGDCVKDFKAEYGLSNYIIAENIGGMTHYEDGEPILGTNVTEAVDGWMSSRGHRYNLLYPEHEKGAIGCYYSICVFLGAHQNPNGFGAGPCTTGEEGLEFWRNASPQPGE